MSNILHSEDGKPISSENRLPVAEQAFKHAVGIAPSDAGAIAPTLGIYVGVSGDVAVDLAGGATVTFKGLSAGVIHPISVTRVYATGTTATDIVGVY